MQIIYIILLKLIHSYNSNVLALNKDVDLWLSVNREATTCFGDRILNNPNFNVNAYELNIYNAVKREGFYEGYGKGWPGRYQCPGLEIVPYGCWFTHANNYDLDSVKYVNLGSNVLINDDGEIYKALKLDSSQYEVCVDKHWCEQALKLGFTSIYRYNYQHEVIVCHGGCANVSFNSSCPPTELRQNFRANKICDCGGAKNQTCELANEFLSCNNGSMNNVIKTPKLTKQSIITDRCVIEDLSIPSKIKEYNHLNMTFIITSNIILNFFHSHSNRSFHHYITKFSDSFENQLHGRATMIIDYEKNGNLQIYGYEKINQLNYHNEKNLSLVDNILMMQNRLQLVGLNSFNKKYHEYSIQYDDFFNHDFFISGRFVENRKEITKHTKFYTNIDGFKYSTLFRVNEFMIGLVMVEYKLLQEMIFDWYDFIDWIHKEVKCLKKQGADIVMLLCDLRIENAMKVLNEIPSDIDFILSVYDHEESSRNNNMKQLYDLCNQHCQYNNTLDKIIMIKPTLNTTNIVAALLTIHAYNDNLINSRLSFSALTTYLNISVE